MMGNQIISFFILFFILTYGVLVRGPIPTTTNDQVIRRLYDVFPRACVEHPNDIAGLMGCTALA